MIYKSEELETKAIMDVATLMCSAARTAPKTRGVDNIITMVLTNNAKDLLVEKMIEIANREFGDEQNNFIRDAKNLKDAGAVVLIGARVRYSNLKFCSLCGFKDCQECANNNARCVFTSMDLGIALTSAATVASQNFVDNRIMYSVGMAAKEMGYSDDNVIWHGIPISVSAKNIFFDRAV